MYCEGIEQGCGDEHPHRGDSTDLCVIGLKNITGHDYITKGRKSKMIIFRLYVIIIYRYQVFKIRKDTMLRFSDPLFNTFVLSSST